MTMNGIEPIKTLINNDQLLLHCNVLHVVTELRETLKLKNIHV